jgi:TonB family protein
MRRASITLFGFVFFLSHAVHPQTSSPVKRVRADWQTFSSSKISGSSPVYPPLATATSIEGAVRIDFVVTTDGTTKDLVVLSGHPLLVQSAIDALRSWRFKPTMLGDTPVEVETVATIAFFLPGHDPSTLLAPYRKNVERHPNDAKEHIALGRQLLNLGETRSATVEFREAISLQPQEALAHFNLGQALAAEGDLDAAVAEYRKGLSIDPKVAYAHFDLGSCLMRNEDLDGAVAEYRLGLQLQPKEGYRHHQFGQLMMMKKDFEAAIVEFRLALHYNMDLPSVHFDLGRALEANGDLAAAAREYQRAVKDSPKNEKFREALEKLKNQSHP